MSLGFHSPREGRSLDALSEAALMVTSCLGRLRHQALMIKVRALP